MLMKVEERLLKYVSYWTTSDETNNQIPSSDREFELARELEKELKELGLDKVILTDNCYVYGLLPATPGMESKKAVGFIAHIDTAPDFSGENVKPQIISNYDGNDVFLKGTGAYLKVSDFPSLSSLKRRTLITTDGTTLLGADDKAGVAEIMTAVEEIINEQIPHGDIWISFTPDEEVGAGADLFDLDYFKADYAYTVDGGDVEDIEFENFNASSATVHIQGLSIHPGSAKNRMINSLLVGFEFNSLLPVFDNPAYTEGYEGFNHLVSMEGDCEKSTMHYIIRNHDLNLLRKQEADFRNAMEFLNKKYGENTITIDFEDSYANMRSYIEKRMDIIDNVKAKMAKLGVTAKSSAIRGGTDGARLTYMGIMCPNLGTGGRNYHGKYEYASINEMKFMAKLLVEIVKVN